MRPHAFCACAIMSCIDASRVTSAAKASHCLLSLSPPSRRSPARRPNRGRRPAPSPPLERSGSRSPGHCPLPVPGPCPAPITMAVLSCRRLAKGPTVARCEPGSLSIPLVFHHLGSAKWRIRVQRNSWREKAIASCLFTFACFRSSSRRRILLRFGLIAINSGTDKIFQSPLINLITFEKIDRSSRIAFEAGVEEA